ncbi:steroid 3-ketoacyl-CoA thiolase [Pseudofrankia asymbiotica]|uniref:Acetyl-CoA acetyltransferase n=1 Tax=Pseudofrankia asymbiotica TaxID=1834516 RepID=A0A1V2IFE3_9ACTN|nr:steroid 3-ketoacyl-CoA thiolase [Pseudofrankia asymbiotica]ONH31775.1 acetyl-CoA acetyltransferase [Pseudofrankia asymbiotica]
MPEVVVVDAARTPFGKRKGALSGMHAVDLLGIVQRAVFDRTGVDPSTVGQVIGGCVSQVGMQSMNVTRTAWLTAGLPFTVPSTTVDAQCGSSQQAMTLAYGLVASGAVESALACGVEVMSRVPMGSTTPRDPNAGKPVNKNYWSHYEFTSQFEGAERLAEKYGIVRADTDAFGKTSQDKAARAWAEDRFATQLVTLDAPDVDEAGKPTGTTHHVARDEGLRATTLEALGALKATGRTDGVHTAGTSSQISDGASAVLLMSREKATALGLTPMATVVDSVLVGCDPVLMLEGPIPATRLLLDRNSLTMADIDLVEINEAFASVVLAWERELKADLDSVNVNGGAIALGHPLGATGTALVAKAVHELARADKEQALVTMCCGGGLGTGTLLRR